MLSVYDKEIGSLVLDHPENGATYMFVFVCYPYVFFPVFPTSHDWIEQTLDQSNIFPDLTILIDTLYGGLERLIQLNCQNKPEKVLYYGPKECATYLDLDAILKALPEIISSRLPDLTSQSSILVIIDSLLEINSLEPKDKRTTLDYLEKLLNGPLQNAYFIATQIAM